MVHKFFSNVLRQSGQRLRANSIFSGPRKTLVAEATELGLRHGAGAGSFGREQVVHRSTERANGDNNAYILIEMSPCVQHSSTCAEPLEEVVHPDSVPRRYIRSIKPVLLQDVRKLFLKLGRPRSLLALLKYLFYPLFILDNGMNLISKSLTVLTPA